MGTLRFFEEVVSFKIRRTFGFADYTDRSKLQKKGRGKIHSLLYRNESPAYSAGAAAGAGC